VSTTTKQRLQRGGTRGVQSNDEGQPATTTKQAAASRNSTTRSIAQAKRHAFAPLDWQPPDARHVAGLTASKIRRSIAEIQHERDSLAELSVIVDRRMLALSLMLTELRREAGRYEFDASRRAA
jgi:hypothetical protein